MTDSVTAATNIDPNIIIGVSDNGWMTSDLFGTWFEKFLLYFTQRPLLVVFDGHSSHVSYQVIKRAKEEGVSLLKLPPHTTDRLQPLDVACFRPLKQKWDKAIHEWNNRFFGMRIPKPEFIRLTSEYKCIGT